MIVCPKCKKEMQCEKNGTTVRFGTGEHCYAGDLFKCPTCGGEAIVTKPTPYYDQDCKSAQPHDVWMDTVGKGYEPTDY